VARSSSTGWLACLHTRSCRSSVLGDRRAEKRAGSERSRLLLLESRGEAENKARGSAIRPRLFVATRNGTTLGPGISTRDVKMSGASRWRLVRL
jgi:hypothetical protein